MTLRAPSARTTRASFATAVARLAGPTLRDGLRGRTPASPTSAGRHSLVRTVPLADRRALARHALGAAPVGTAPQRFADTRLARAVVVALLAMIVASGLIMLIGQTALAAPVEPTAPTAPVEPGTGTPGTGTPGTTDGTTPGTGTTGTTPTDFTDGDQTESDGSGTGGLNIDINGPDGAPSTAVVTLLGITLLSVAPALLLMMTSFTKIFVVLAMTRNALALPSIPPNQVLAGLALFLSLFIMAPILEHINADAVQPYLDGSIDFQAAIDAGSAPLREFMLAHTRQEDLALMTRSADQPNPDSQADVPMLTLIPSFMISELRAAFIIGFVIFIPFLVIDLVVSAALMSMGMMMLPPVMISLPFKILLFVLVDGWGLIITSLIESYQVTA
ncbi:flagellar type III secretion system pore protein FliP [Frigoribacterium sp. CFBP9029]|uniref:flagellar type III secretion system pore protein FliP n=1 Tax=Frigoribacterium sp. CFBP9029 TaxID=3096541 RepID=UPI0039C86F1B